MYVKDIQATRVNYVSRKDLPKNEAFDSQDTKTYVTVWIHSL